MFTQNILCYLERCISFYLHIRIQIRTCMFTVCMFISMLISNLTWRFKIPIENLTPLKIEWNICLFWWSCENVDRTSRDWNIYQINWILEQYIADHKKSRWKKGNLLWFFIVKKSEIDTDYKTKHNKGQAVSNGRWKKTLLCTRTWLVY